MTAKLKRQKVRAFHLVLPEYGGRFVLCFTGTHGIAVLGVVKEELFEETRGMEYFSAVFHGKSIVWFFGAAGIKEVLAASSLRRAYDPAKTERRLLQHIDRLEDRAATEESEDLAFRAERLRGRLKDAVYSTPFASPSTFASFVGDILGDEKTKEMSAPSYSTRSAALLLAVQRAFRAAWEKQGGWAYSWDSRQAEEVYEPVHRAT